MEYIAIDFSRTSNCKQFIAKCLSIFEDGKTDYIFLIQNSMMLYKEWVNLKNCDSFDIENNNLIEKAIQ